MNPENEKCVIVIDENMPPGVIANAAAILGITIGMKRPDTVGEDVTDRNGVSHTGIIKFPVPVLKCGRDVLKDIRGKLSETQFQNLTAVDFSDLAQGCRTYDEYIGKMSECCETELNYIGIAVCGDKKQVNKLTGSLPLMR